MAKENTPPQENNDLRRELEKHQKESLGLHARLISVYGQEEELKRRLSRLEKHEAELTAKLDEMRAKRNELIAAFQKKRRLPGDNELECPKKTKMTHRHKLIRLELHGGIVGTYLYFCPTEFRKISAPEDSIRNYKKWHAPLYARFLNIALYHTCPLCGLIKGRPGVALMRPAEALEKGLGGDIKLYCKKCRSSLSDIYIKSDDFLKVEKRLSKKRHRKIAQKNPYKE